MSLERRLAGIHRRVCFETRAFRRLDSGQRPDVITPAIAWFCSNAPNPSTCPLSSDLDSILFGVRFVACHDPDDLVRGALHLFHGPLENRDVEKAR